MDILQEKFEIYRDVILSDMHVNDDLLKLMMEGHLIDAAESAKYKAMADSQQRNQELMTAMIERRTDRAYPILLDCLRKSGQDRIADLLTDVTQEPEVVSKSEADDTGTLVRAISSTTLTIEKPSPAPTMEKPSPTPTMEKPSPTPTMEKPSPPTYNPSEMDPVREVNANLEALLSDLSPFLSKEERRIGLVTKDSGPEEKQEPEVRNDGNSDDQALEAESQQAERQLWHSVHTTMVSAITEIGRCQTVIKKLHEDCQAVAEVNSEIAAQIKDCDNTVRDLLRTHRLPVADSQTAQRTMGLFKMLMEDIHVLSEGRNRIMIREKETRTQSMRMLRMLRDWLDERCQALSQLHATITTSSPTYRYNQTSTRLSVHSSIASASLVTSPAVSRQGDVPSLIVEPHPISSVSEGIHLLEHQVKEYIHLETFLTDKHRADLRIKQLQKKAQGYTSKGFFSVKQYVDNIEQGADVDENLERLKGVLVKLSEEYDQCVHYMKRVTANMPKAADGQTPAESIKPPEPPKPEPKPTKRGGFFRRKAKEPVVVPTLRLPKLVPENTFSNLDSRSESLRGKPLLHRLKTLVSNYESAKNSENALTEKFRQDWDRKKKDLTEVIRKKDEEILNLHFRLKEMTADRDKYRKLYEQAKASVGRK